MRRSIVSHRQIHRSAGCLWFRDDQLLQVIAFHHKEKGKIPYVYKWKNDKTDSSETETQTLYSWSELSLHRKQDSLTKSSRNRSCIDNSKMKLISGVLPLNVLIMRKYQASLSSLFRILSCPVRIVFQNVHMASKCALQTLITKSRNLFLLF